MRQVKWILDPGHGGMAFGHYCTAGKRSPHVPPGIYEGDFNREVASRLIKEHDLDAELDGSHIAQCQILAPGPVNIPLKSRVDFVNKIPFPARDMALISIHANAAPGLGWRQPHGSRLFLSKRCSGGSLRLNAHLSNEIDKADVPRREATGEVGYSLRDRIPFLRRSTLRKSYTIIQRVKCPAILVECGFMTHEQDATWLATEGAAVWADVIFRAMVAYQEGLE